MQNDERQQSSSSLIAVRGQHERERPTASNFTWDFARLTKEFRDVRLVASDGHSFDWECSRLVAICPTLLSKAIHVDNSTPPRLILRLPFSSQLIRQVVEGLLPDDTLDKEKLLLELEKIDSIGWQSYRDAVIENLYESIAPGNCIALWILCRKYTARIQSTVLRYCLYHLVSALRNRTICRQYFRLSKEMLRELLDYDCLDVRTEEDVFYAIDKWIEIDPTTRAQHRTYLATTVRLKGLEPTRGGNLQESLGGLALSRNPKRKRRDILISFSGWNAGEKTNIEYWDEFFFNFNNFPMKRRWVDLKTMRFPERLQYYGVVVLDEEIYVIGGALETEIVSSVRKFSSVDRQWKEVCPMNERRSFITNACVTLDGCIYVCGGADGRFTSPQRETPRLSSCERYNPKTNLWEGFAFMHFGRSDAAVAAGAGKLFVSGGFNGRESLKSVEMYLPSANSWTEIAMLPYRLTGHAMLHDGASLIVLGGFSDNEINGQRRVESKVLVWKNSMWAWDRLADMCFPRSTFSAALYNGEMVVCGGQPIPPPIIERFDGEQWLHMGLVSDGGHDSAKILVIPNWRDEAEKLEHDSSLPPPTTAPASTTSTSTQSYSLFPSSTNGRR